MRPPNRLVAPALSLRLVVVRLPAPAGIVVDPGDGHGGGCQHVLLAAAALVVDGDADVGVEGAAGAGVVGRGELHVVECGVGRATVRPVAV